MAVAPYDVKINGVGYMVDIAQGGPVTPTDLQPGTTRASDGEADFIRYEAESGHQITDFSGGAGQRRHVSTNRWLTGIGNGVFGPFFPPYKQLTEASTGGTASWYTRIGSTLYGKTSTQFEQIGSATTISSSGTPNQAPVQTGAGAMWYTSGGDLFRVDSSGSTNRGGTGSTTVLPDAEFDMVGAAAFGRHLFAWAKRAYTTTPSVRQSAQHSWGGNIHLGMKWDKPTIPGNVLLACFLSNSSAGVTPQDSAWEEIMSHDKSSVPEYNAQVYIIKNNDGFRAATEIFEATEDVYAVGFLVEVENVHDGRYPDVIFDITSSENATTTTIDTGTAENGGLSVAFLGWIDNTSDSGTIPAGTGWTEHDEIEATDSSSVWIGGSIQSDDTNTSISVSLGTAADATVGFIVSFKDFDTAFEQDVILATADEGESWLLAPADFTSEVIGTPRAFKPWNGYLWFTTQYGMFRMRYGEDEYLAGNRTLNIAVEQVADFRDYPQADNAGKWLEVYDNGLYTGVEDALFRYTEGGGFEPVFPTPDWATVGGQIRAIVRAGRVLFFGAGSYLWLFNGRSFHPVADPAADTDMDYMAFHNGKLYLNDDPSTYFNVGNPSLRPDINDATAASVTTGYYISSRLDFHKVNILKLISEFEEQVRFTQATNTGTVKWDYIKACSDDPDPGRYGGNASALTWTTITTHAKGDTSPKSTDINPEIACKALYLRATLTPGTLGFPYIEYVAPIGRAKPPVQRRIVVPIMLKIGLRDHAGTEVYSSQSAIETAINNLQALRDPDSTTSGIDVLFDEESAGGETIRGDVVAVTPRRVGKRSDEGRYWRVDVTIDELP